MGTSDAMTAMQQVKSDDANKDSNHGNGLVPALGFILALLALVGIAAAFGS